MEAVGKAYNADRGEEINAFILNHELHVDGAIIDTIVDRHSFQQGTPDERHAHIDQWYTQQNKKYPNGEDFGKALASVQVADVKYGISGFPVARGNSVNNQLLIAGQADLNSDGEKAQDKMRISLDRATTLRGLCHTERGYLGLVPWSPRNGDHICVLLGGQVLYVLRPSQIQSQPYEYIGECCAHALMDGEALDWVREGNSQMQEFVLV